LRCLEINIANRFLSTFKKADEELDVKGLQVPPLFPVPVP